MNKELIEKMADRVSQTKDIIKLQNDYFNLIPSLEKIDKGELAFYYNMFNNALFNIFEVNQRLLDDLEEVATVLYIEVEESEDTEDDDTY